MSNAENVYIVVARVDSSKGGNHTDCQVVEEGADFLAIYKKVYGPDTEENCTNWKEENCVPKAAAR